MVGIVTAACGGAGSRATTEGTQETGGTNALVAKDVKVEALTTLKWKPSDMTAEVGQPVKITMTSDGSLEHTFVWSDQPDSDFLHTAKNETKDGPATRTFDKAGTYEFYCDMPGHREAGMTGSITVTAAEPERESNEVIPEKATEVPVAVATEVSHPASTATAIPAPRSVHDKDPLVFDATSEGTLECPTADQGAIVLDLDRGEEAVVKFIPDDRTALVILSQSTRTSDETPGLSIQADYYDENGTRLPFVEQESVFDSSILQPLSEGIEVYSESEFYLARPESALVVYGHITFPIKSVQIAFACPDRFVLADIFEDGIGIFGNYSLEEGARWLRAP